ncbi:NIMA (never in mitosisa)-related kinase [Monoraphidium neglectum]|uniref:NIMA (Never in mitosisa)-related kinase n=1 Tax=Monoraphidium neglectum TaxID=145388 RepID=A0A0D2LL74_9CHLO|nr:NIMA (never in mitosisa)-related kinase [Monoraphidium neglectum]KIY92594.1 NIMA (never in mitosisa)-related kinase [Monoraphidium neglectum]|eukprot:XP_013891614.1 NIMA (never in mitosisa)-related kinase [Monoraphidium neglectum]
MAETLEGASRAAGPEGAPPPALAALARPELAALMVDASRVALGRRLGAGAHATVYAAALLPAEDGARGAAGRARPGGRLVAKCLDRTGPGHLGQVAREIELLALAGRHPNILQLHGWFWRPPPPDGAGPGAASAGRDGDGLGAAAGGGGGGAGRAPVLCLLLERCEGGTLGAILKSRAGAGDAEAPPQPFPEDTVMGWFVQLLLALDRLHSIHVCHRDIKPENILLCGGHRILKLADLGVSTLLDSANPLAETCMGTPAYTAPEVIAGRPYSTAADVWSAGCTLVEMAARRPAFDARGLPQAMPTAPPTSAGPAAARQPPRH